MARQGRERRTERDDQRANQSNDDSVKHAPESGEPEEAGRTRGKVIEEDGGARGPAKAGGTVDESGRHGATPD
jgi:hypothetical protein